MRISPTDLQASGGATPCRSADKVAGEASSMADKLEKTEAAGRFDDMNLTWRSSASFLMTYGKVLPCRKQYHHDWLVCAFTHPGEAMCRRDPTRFAYTGIACPDKKDGYCKRGESCPYSHNTFEYWLHPTRYHTQLCQFGAQCSHPICFFAHSSAELREPTWGTSLPQDVLATARLAVSTEVARQNMVDATQDSSALQALGKAVALAVVDTFALHHAAINPALNVLSSNAVAADLLVELLAELHRSKQITKHTSSRRAMPKHAQDDQGLSLLQPRRKRSPSLGAAASERQQLALHSFSQDATDPGNQTRLSNKLVPLQAQLQSAADFGVTNGVPSSVWALQSALYPGQQREEHHPQPLCAESHKPWAVPFDSPYLSELDPSEGTGYFQGHTSSDWYCPLSNEKWTDCARSSAQAAAVGVNADGQLRRNAFDVRQLRGVFVCVQLNF
ncbi:TPA: hypothetical protein ACH3X1_002755 [Trebouxia sp. C0004]